MLVDSYSDFVRVLSNIEIPEFISYNLKNVDDYECITLFPYEKVIREKIHIVYGLMDIRFLPENRNNGRFSQIISLLENKNFSVSVNNILNPLIISSLRKRNWVEMHSYKCGGVIKDMILLKNL